MIYLIPYTRFTIETEKSREEIVAILRENTKIGSVNPSILDMFEKSKTFKGKINEDNFKIALLIWYRNSFLPIIHGNIKESRNKSTVVIHMRIAYAVMAFMSLWLYVPASIIVQSIVSSDPIIIVFAPMILFGYVLMIIAFNVEVTRSKDSLLELLR